MKTILVVDDEQSIRDVLADILTDEGYRVVSAGDGLTALQMLASEVIDCILLDVWLPGKGGIEVLDRHGQRLVDNASVNPVLTTGTIRIP